MRSVPEHGKHLLEFALGRGALAATLGGCAGGRERGAGGQRRGAGIAGICGAAKAGTGAAGSTRKRWGRQAWRNFLLPLLVLRFPFLLRTPVWGRRPAMMRVNSPV